MLFGSLSRGSSSLPDDPGTAVAGVAFRGHVRHVVIVSAKEKVIVVYAGAVVTVVQDV